MKKFIALLALLIAAPVLADVVAVEVVHPTTYTDSAQFTGEQPIPATIPVGTAIDCGPTAVAGDFAHGWVYVTSLVVPLTATTIDIPSGWYCAAHSAMNINGTWGTQSDYGAVVQYVKPAPAAIVPGSASVPKPPVLKIK